jgi:putative proteasome-type protease
VTDVTYCLAMRLDEGLLFMSDTRTNAGVDNVGTYRKLHVFHPSHDRLFVVQSAGNLATTHEVLDQVTRDLRGPGESLATVASLFQAGLYLGGLGSAAARRHEATLGANATATLILGGQVGTDPPDILLVYPEGNCIRASDDLPFLQIGETKYGKAWLDLAVRSQAGLLTASKIALSSMISTAVANLSVGPPYDLGLYERDSYELRHARIESDSPYLTRLTKMWRDHMLAGVDSLPDIEPGDITVFAPDHLATSELPITSA